jgi:hypothetical protein
MEIAVKDLQQQIANKDECYAEAHQKLIQERDALK